LGQPGKPGSSTNDVLLKTPPPAMVSPVMVGAEAASPQPTVPSCASMRTMTLRAWVTVSAAIFTGLVSGSATGIASTRRITSGFHRVRAARFLPSGRLLALWAQDKTYGIDAMDADGKNRETLSEGSTYYRTISPSPDGRFLVATYTFDLGFHALDALKLRQTEEVRLLDVQGRPLARLVHSWRDRNHSPSWTR